MPYQHFIKQGRQDVVLKVFCGFSLKLLAEEVRLAGVGGAGVLPMLGVNLLTALGLVLRPCSLRAVD